MASTRSNTSRFTWHQPFLGLIALSLFLPLAPMAGFAQALPEFPILGTRIIPGPFQANGPTPSLPALPGIVPGRQGINEAPILMMAQATPTPELPGTLRPGLPVYKYAYAAVDPTPSNNPPGKDYPGNRGVNQIVIYTPASGLQATGTNTFGAEAVVKNGVVDSVDCCNTTIPSDGMVISAHGSAGEWMKKMIQPGMSVVVDENSRLLLFQNTPEGFLHQTQRHLEMVKQRPDSAVSNSANYQNALQKAESCLAALSKEVDNVNANNDLITREEMQALKNKANDCKHETDLAYFQSVPTKPEEFRGVWLRPLERTPEQMQKTVQRLKALGIKDIFIETYYQGKSIYPSATMQEYGLAAQHPRFKGQDPLADWIKLAHDNGIKVHAWTQIFFAGNKDENAEQFGPILNRYPQWANIRRSTLCSSTECKLTGIVEANTPGIPPGFSDVEPGHYFVDPSNPEVQAFLQKMLKEIVTNYDVDGINLDYIRYPATLPVQSPRFLQSNWGYTPYARKQFIAMMEKEQAEKPKAAGEKTATPDPLRYDPVRISTHSTLWDRWVNWRKAQVSTFVETTQEQLRQIKPQLTMTAVVFPWHDPKSQIKLQDWPTWVEKGWLNALTPIGLYPTPEGIFKDSMKFREMTQDKVPVYVGIFGAYNRIAPADFVAQIDAAHQAGMPGIMLFENSRLSEPYRDALQQGPFRE